MKKGGEKEVEKRGERSGKKNDRKKVGFSRD